MDGVTSYEQNRDREMPGSAKAMKGERSEKGRDGFKPDAIECEDDANNDEESEEEGNKKGR